eukprot:UN09903
MMPIAQRRAVGAIVNAIRDMDNWNNFFEYMEKRGLSHLVEQFTPEPLKLTYRSYTNDADNNNNNNNNSNKTASPSSATTTSSLPPLPPQAIDNNNTTAKTT